jgi:glycopeptide antibiotics resistance protein
MIAYLDALGDPALLWPILLLVGSVGMLVIAITQRSRDRTVCLKRLLRITLSCSLAAILVLTLTPRGGANERQLVPLVHIIRGHPAQYRVDVFLNVVGNSLAFLPLGATLSLLGFRFRTTVLVAFGLSVLIEATQLFVPGRTTSTDDVLLNTFGALLGHALVRPWRRQPADAAISTK